MGKFSAKQDIENYGSKGNGSFFSLKNHKDTAKVRFMYESVEDIDGYALHEVEVDGRKRYVNCLREYDDPIENCPLCAAKIRVIPKLFILLYDEDSQEVKIWDRGRTFFDRLEGLCNRYDPLVSTVFEIERNGKPNDPGTKYEFYPLGTDETLLEDLPELPEIMGGLILDKSFEDLEFFLEEGNFPESDAYDAEPEPAVSRREVAATNTRRTAEPRTTRRPPAQEDSPAARTSRGKETTQRRRPPATDKF